MGCNFCHCWFLRAYLDEYYVNFTSLDIQAIDFKCNERLKMKRKSYRGEVYEIDKL